MKYLLEIATKESHFLFNGKTYRQHNGIAMGNPLGPLFADIYVKYLENKYMKRIQENGVLHYKRFVDDTFTLVHKNTNKNKIIDILNSYDNQIQFTCEEEQDEALPFLDVKIKRNQQQSTPFATSIYRKKTFTGKGVSRRFLAAATDKIFIRRRRRGHSGEKLFAAAAAVD